MERHDFETEDTEEEVSGFLNTRAQASVFVSIKYYAEGIISFEPTFVVSVLEISGRGYHFDDVEKVANLQVIVLSPPHPSHIVLGSGC